MQDRGTRKRSQRYQLRPDRALLAIAGVVAIAVLCLTAFVPVYTDEINYKQFDARLLIDGHTQGLLQCTEPAYLPAPVTQLPARLLFSAAYGNFDAPVVVRLGGELVFLLLVACLAGCILASVAEVTSGPASKTHAGHPSPDARIITLAATLFLCVGVGVVPFMATNNRPEQLLLLTAAAALLIVRASTAGRLADRASWPVFAVALVLAELGLSAHAKGMLLVPIYLVLAWTIRSRLWRGAYVALLGAMVVDSFVFNARRWSFAHCPLLHDEFRSRSMLQPAVLFSDPKFFLARISRNALDAPFLLAKTRIAGVYMSGWLPSHDLAAPARALQYSIIAIAILTLFAGLVAGTRVLARHAVSQRTRWDLSDSMSAAITVSLLAIALLQQQRNAYDAGFLYGLLGIAFVAFLPTVFSLFSATRLRQFARMGVVMGIVSCAQLLWVFAPAVADGRWLSGSAIPGQPSSVAVVGMHAERPAIVSAAAKCGIRPGDGSRRLLLDDAAYTVFWPAQEVLPVVNLVQWGRDVPDLAGYLRRVHSSGGVMLCDAVPLALQTTARPTGRYCCLPAY